MTFNFESCPILSQAARAKNQAGVGEETRRDVKRLMSNYAYVAVDPQGLETRGSLEVSDQCEAIRRIKEMGLFPTKLVEEPRVRALRLPPRPEARRKAWSAPIPGTERIKPRTLSVFTRQLATLVEAGMPLIRGLKTLEEQEENRTMKRVIAEVSEAIEGGSSFTEAVARRPRVFGRVYVNMVKAGEVGGAMEVTLRRLAEFMEKAARIKGKVRSALFYPCSVLFVAVGILMVMMTFVVPRFKSVFDGLLNGMPMPPLTAFVLSVSNGVHGHLLALGLFAGVGFILLLLALRTPWGRGCLDRAKLVSPLIGPVCRKAAISRFCRTRAPW